MIVDHVRGSVLGDVFAGPLQASTAEVTAGFGTAIGELAAIHGVPWAPALASWSSPRTPRDEVEHWVPVLHKAQDPGWVRAGLHVREQLLATAPEQARTGVVHGDFHPGNWLFEGRRLTAVLDWESSSIGPQPLDLAWLCMVCDEHSWGPIRRAWMGTTPSPDWIAARYEQETGSPVEGLRWFRALAGYRLACLTAHFLRLHRTGRRPDPVWEVFADAFHALLERGSDLLSQP